MSRPVWLLDEDEATTAYECTDDFTLDAINEFATWAPDALPPSLLADVLDWFRGTFVYEQTIEDIRCGDRELA